MSRIRAKLLISQEQYTNIKNDHPFKIQTNSQSNTKLLQKFLSTFQEQSKSQAHFFNKMFDQFKSSIDRKTKHQLRQVRDRKVELPVPRFSNTTVHINQQIEKWLTNVCGQIFSIAFHHYINGHMTFDQCKIYCSQNILRNIALLSEQNQLKPDLFQTMDKHIKKSILRYMMKKYPLTEAINTYKELNSLVKQIDNYQKFQYDFFHYSHIVFELRESANYNDLIMKVVNKKIKQIEIVEDADNPEGQGLSNYQKFEKYFSKLLQQVYNPNWMTQIQSQNKLHSLFFRNNIPTKNSVVSDQLIQDIVGFISCQQEKKHLPYRQREQYQQKQRKFFIQTLKYKEKVKQYTNILIGRKIPDSVVPYNDKQIGSLHLVIKSSSILRILTKWCEQLWTKFQHPDYYLVNHEQGLRVQRGGNINMMSLQLKQSLCKLMQEQKQQIQLFMSEIGKNNYEMQFSLMKKQLQNTNSSTFLEPLEKVCGVFSLKVVNNLHNYIITYLNRLIHGLLTVSDKWFNHNKNLLKTQIWPSPPNLLTLKIGDLMRCKCESREREIVNLYKHIVRLSKQMPQEIKIIRVKNRLNSSTNDILLNLLMFGKHVCQVQLSVQSKKSRFHQYSNQFSHYLYQLQRSLFGPVTQLCSIWSTLDQRKAIYDQFVGSSYNNSNLQDHECQQTKKAKFKNFQRPFICSLCKVAYSHNNFIIRHLKCENCNFWKCAKCQLAQYDQETILQNIVLNSQIRQDCKKISNYVYSTRDLPQYGFCIFICSKIPKVQYFRKMKMKNKDYLFGQRDCGKIYQIADINSNKHLKQFIKNYIVFSLPHQIGSKQVNISRQKANHQYLIIKYRNQVYSKQRESICLQQQKITDEICENLFSEKAKQKQYIKRIDLQSNQITKIKVICYEFPHLKSLQLNQNKINNYEGLQNLKELQQLSIGQNQLSEGQFPHSICELSKLQVLNMQNTHLEVLPQNIKKLQNLKMFQLGNNLVKDIPDQVGELQNLQNLSVYSNRLEHITQKIGNLKKLNTLILSNNNLAKIPKSISQLSSLLKLDIQGNDIQELNFSFARLQSIEELQLSNNKIKNLPQDLGELCYLKSFNVSRNQLKKLPKKINWNKLMVLNLNDNQINQINSSLFNCLNILKMEISNNLLQSISQDIGNLKKLIVLNLSKNKLSVCPNNVTHLQNLTFLSFSQNQITKIPLNIGNLYKLQCFYASANHIVQIPFTIRRCLSLKQLYLNDNQITIIPQELSNLTNIQHSQLDLSENPIQQVLCINYVLSRGDNATKREIIEKLKLMPEVQDINLTHIELPNNHIRKTSLRSRRRQLVAEELNKRSTSSQH